MKTALLVLALPALLSAGDFWKEKSPADWTEKEARKMTRSSPWAHEASPRMEGMMGGGMPSGGRGGRGGRSGGAGAGAGADAGGGPGAGMGGDAGGGGGGMGGAGAGAGALIPNVHVRWDSATPVREAYAKLDVANPFPKELADKAAGYYVITVEGMRMQMGRPGPGQPGQQGDQIQLTQDDVDRLQDRMARSAALIRKDKEPLRPDGVRLMPGVRGPAYQLFFKKTDPITQDEKEVKVVVKMGPMTIETKFKPKDMVFAGLLAL
ncbi:MAG: hypothetical protein C0504_18720 [Candidatus Solibacter sp.]|nr:hypothetical protein [Candidatus Solibacter sp.]